MTKTKIILLVSIPVLIAGAAFAYMRMSDKNSQPAPVTQGENNNPTSNEESINKLKESLSEEDESTQTDKNTGLKSVKPDITYSGVYQGNVEVSSHVPGIFENSGKCTLKLVKDGKTVSQSKTAVPNVSEMSCGLIKIPISKLSSGTWTATVSYSSVKAKGTSDSVAIEVK